MCSWLEEKRGEGIDVLDIMEMDAPTMEFWLSRFVVEARKQDRSEYPTKSCYILFVAFLKGIYLSKAITCMKVLLNKQEMFLSRRRIPLATVLYNNLYISAKIKVSKKMIFFRGK